MKRYIACLMAAALLLLACASCAAANEEPSVGSAPTASQAVTQTETMAVTPSTPAPTASQAVTLTPTATPVTPTPTETSTQTPTETPVTPTPTASQTVTPTPATPTPTETPVTPTPTETPTETPDVQASTKPNIKEKFGTADSPREISFYVNGGDHTSLASRSISVDIDLDGAEPLDLTFEPNLMTQRRNDMIKEEIGTEIVVKKIGTLQGSVADLKPILQTQQPYYDVLALYQYYDLDLAIDDTVGSFYNYERMPADVTSYLNLNAPYWNKEVYNATKFTRNGVSVSFFLTGDLTQTNAGNMAVSFVNAQLWEQYKDRIKDLENSGGYDDIYDIVNNGYWTLDLWMELANLCFGDENGNGTPDKDDRLGVLLYNNEDAPRNMSAEYLSYGSGVRYTKTDNNGEPAAAVNSKQNMAFFNKLYSLYCETNVGTMKYTDEKGERLMDRFAGGSVLTVVGELRDAETCLRNMVNDYYIMPVPMLDHAQFNESSASKGYATSISDSLTQFAICVYGGDERLPAVTATLELMGYYSALWVTPAYYEYALKYRVASGRNLAVLEMTRAGVYADFGFVWSPKLGNVSWVIRSEYDKKSGMENLMKQWQNTVKGKLKTLLSFLDGTGRNPDLF